MQKYLDNVTNILLDFQLIEAVLRSYIISANKKIKERVKDICPYKYDRTWVDKDSLSKLLSKFEKINGNDTLIKEIRCYIPKRNEVAHKSMLSTINMEEKQDFKDKKTKELVEMHDKLNNIFLKLLEELKKINREQNNT